jgi:hypothetical protein
MAQLTLTRRQLIQALIALGLAGAAWKFFGGDDHDTTTVSSPPTITDPNNPSFEVFLSFSTIVTMHKALDIPTARKIYDLIMTEPWGPQHLTACYEKLQKQLHDHDTKHALTAGESWFFSHILTTWYLGIYYHEKRPTQRVTLEHALMYTQTKGFMPIPYFESTGFAGWTKPPEVQRG